MSYDLTKMSTTDIQNELSRLRGDYDKKVLELLREQHDLAEDKHRLTDSMRAIDRRMRDIHLRSKEVGAAYRAVVQPLQVELRQRALVRQEQEDDPLKEVC